MSLSNSSLKPKELIDSIFSETYSEAVIFRASSRSPFFPLLYFHYFVYLQMSWGQMKWNGEAANLTGILALVLMAVVAITSIPSVAESLNWVEWVFIQSKLGYVVLALSLLHAMIVARFWKGYSFTDPDLWKTRKTLCTILPIIVLVLKISFSLPPLSSYLNKIRKGWERASVKRIYYHKNQTMV